MKKYYIGLCLFFSVFSYLKETLINNEKFTVVNITKEGEYEIKEGYSTYGEAK